MAFDVISPVKFGQGEIGLMLTTFRTTPLLTRDIIKTMDIANNGTTYANVSLYLVPDGGVADNTNILLPSVRVPINSLFQWSGTQILNEGDTIQAISSIVDVALHVSGGEAT